MMHPHSVDNILVIANNHGQWKAKSYCRLGSGPTYTSGTGLPLLFKSLYNTHFFEFPVELAVLSARQQHHVH